MRRAQVWLFGVAGLLMLAVLAVLLTYTLTYRARLTEQQRECVEAMHWLGRSAVVCVQ